jgi:hypothetical protein
MQFRPVSPSALVETIVAALPPGTVRLAVDGPPCADPASVAERVVDALARPVAHVRAEMFWRDASLRFEHGRQDVVSYLTWLDAEALRREVLDPVLTGRYLPSLRDPLTNRSTREPARDAQPGTVVVVSGTFLLGRDLPFDLTVHLAVSAAGRSRQTPVSEQWTLPAFASYDEAARPLETADIAVRYDDPARPAIAIAR